MSIDEIAMLVLSLCTVCSMDYPGVTFGYDVGILSVIKYSFDGDSTYVSSRWVEQVDVYGGEVINVFNDGPTESRGPFGPFYELETSSPAESLKEGEQIEHKHTTFHFTVVGQDVDQASTNMLGVSLQKISCAFKDRENGL